MAKIASISGVRCLFSALDGRIRCCLWLCCWNLVEWGHLYVCTSSLKYISGCTVLTRGNR